MEAARRNWRRFSLILGFATLGFLAYSSLVPSVEPAEFTRPFKVAPTSPVTDVPIRVRTTTSGPGSAAFPLATSADRRYLQDQAGQPFPILGRAAWAITSLSVTDYQAFIDDTVNKGFNTIDSRLIAGAGDNPLRRERSAFDAA
jgi:hypothetical protein